MRINKTVCDRCGREITDDDIDYMSEIKKGANNCHYVISRCNQYHKSYDLDLCPECYCKLIAFLGVEMVEREIGKNGELEAFFNEARHAGDDQDA